MKVEVVNRSEKEVENCDYRRAMDIKINGKVVFSVADGEPKDRKLSRDFNDIYNVPRLLKFAFEAGRNGESFELKISESDEI